MTRGRVRELVFIEQCTRSAREELLYRIRQRDSWFRIQLLSQLILFALASGVEIAGVRSASSANWALLVSAALSLLTAVSYFIEDLLVHLQNRYLATLSVRAGNTGGWGPSLQAWDGSSQFNDYIGRVLRLRVISQFIAFIVPSWLAATYVCSACDESWMRVVSFVSAGISTFIILLKIIWVRRLRREPLAAKSAQAEDGRVGGSPDAGS